MQTRNWKFKLGIALIVICIPFFASLLVIPFLDIATTTKVTSSTVALIIGEVLFWSGGLLLGKELISKYNAYLNPKNWFKKKEHDISQE